jgi:hypothetical protein
VPAAAELADAVLADASPAGAVLTCAVLAGAELCALPAAGDLPGVAGAVDGPNVATDSIAPATRHTARMLASSGMIAPCPPNGAVSLRSRVRRRCARCSRW